MLIRTAVDPREDPEWVMSAHMCKAGAWDVHGDVAPPHAPAHTRVPHGILKRTLMGRAPMWSGYIRRRGRRSAGAWWCTVRHAAGTLARWRSACARVAGAWGSGIRVGAATARGVPTRARWCDNAPRAGTGAARGQRGGGEPTPRAKRAPLGALGGLVDVGHAARRGKGLVYATGGGTWAREPD